MASVFLDHDFGRFYNGRDGVALLELEFIRAAARDCAFNQVIADPNSNEGHHIAKLNLFDRSAQFVSG